MDWMNKVNETKGLADNYTDAELAEAEEIIRCMVMGSKAYRKMKSDNERYRQLCNQFSRRSGL